MLTEMRIEGLGVIDEATLDLHAGLIILFVGFVTPFTGTKTVCRSGFMGHCPSKRISSANRS